MSVMIVDDDEMILKSLAIVLRRKFRVRTFASPDAVVAQARVEPPDIIVLDIKMPGHDGFWVFHEIRKFNKGVPIIFNSAFQEMLSETDLRASYAGFGSCPRTVAWCSSRAWSTRPAATQGEPAI